MHGENLKLRNSNTVTYVKYKKQVLSSSSLARSVINFHYVFLPYFLQY